MAVIMGVLKCGAVVSIFFACSLDILMVHGDSLAVFNILETKNDHPSELMAKSAPMSHLR